MWGSNYPLTQRLLGDQACVCVCVCERNIPEKSMMYSSLIESSNFISLKFIILWQQI